MPIVVDEETEFLGLPLPHPSNTASEDAVRIAQAFEGVDTHAAAVIMALAGKAASVHGHAISAITGLQTELDGKSAVDHTHTLDELSDVTTDGATNGQFLKRVGTAWQPVTIQLGDTSGLEDALDDKADLDGISIVVPRGNTATRPSAGGSISLLRYNTELQTFEGWNGSEWGGIGGGAEISETPPSPAQNGNLWWSSALGILFIYYDDGDTAQWVSTNLGADPALMLLRANNLAELASVDTALTNLGFGAFGKTLRTADDAAAARASLGLLWKPISLANVAVTVSSVEFTLPSGYTNFRLSGSFIPTTASPGTNNSLSARVAYGGGAFITASDYRVGFMFQAGSNVTGSALATAASIPLCLQTETTFYTRQKVETEITQGSSNENPRFQSVSHGWQNAVGFTNIIYSGLYNNNVVMDRLQLIAAAGNIGAGSRFLLEGF